MTACPALPAAPIPASVRVRREPRDPWALAAPLGLTGEAPATARGGATKRAGILAPHRRASPRAAPRRRHPPPARPRGAARHQPRTAARDRRGGLRSAARRVRMRAADRRREPARARKYIDEPQAGSAPPAVKPSATRRIADVPLIRPEPPVLAPLSATPVHGSPARTPRPDTCAWFGSPAGRALGLTFGTSSSYPKSISTRRPRASTFRTTVTGSSTTPSARRGAKRAAPRPPSADSSATSERKPVGERRGPA